MAEEYVNDEEFISKDFSKTSFIGSEYNGCRFQNCNFVTGNLAGGLFINCHFENCDMANCLVEKTGFQKVHFHECRMIGIQFDKCNPFLLSMNLIECQLNFCSFYKLKLKGASFQGSTMVEVDLSEADLTNAILEGCDLTRATFDRTNLTGAHLRNAYGYSIDPLNNKITKAYFSRGGLSGLLDSFRINID